MFTGEMWKMIANWPLLIQVALVIIVVVYAFISTLVLLHRKISIKAGEGITFDRMRSKRRKSDS